MSGKDWVEFLVVMLAFFGGLCCGRLVRLTRDDFRRCWFCARPK
jgi:hypothetical protein